MVDNEVKLAVVALINPEEFDRHDTSEHLYVD